MTILLRRRIQRLERKATRAEADGKTLQAIKHRRALYNEQVKLLRLTEAASG